MEKAISFIMEQARKEGTRTTDRLRIGREQTSTADRELGGQREKEITATLTTYKYTATRTEPRRELRYIIIIIAEDYTYITSGWFWVWT